MQTIKRAISLMLVFALALGMCPQYAFAADDVQQVTATEETQTLEPAAEIPEETVQAEEIMKTSGEGETAPPTEIPEETVEEATEASETDMVEPVEETTVPTEAEEPEDVPDEENEAPTEETMPVEEEQIIHTETRVIIPDTDGLPSDAELFAAYAERVLYGNGAAAFGMKAGDRLTGDAKLVYDAIAPIMQEIARGDRSNTWITVGEDLDGYGVDVELELDGSFQENGWYLYDMMDALLADMPYEMYWFDKVSGMFLMFNWIENSDGTCDYQVELLFNVAQNYGNGGYEVISMKDGETGETVEVYNYVYTDTSKTGAASHAADAAWEVVASVEEMVSTDYDKLLAYKDWICDTVSYDDDAAGHGDFSADNDPWQIINVFDGDSSTNVVCEGYAKAFQYLCDLTDWNGDVSCYCVSGVLVGAGDHMWNIVVIGGESYLVDVTDSDAGTVGDDGSLFLVGTAPDSNGYYTFSNEYGITSTYVYDYYTQEQWGDAGILELSETSYDPSGEGGDEEPDTYCISYDANGGLYPPEPQTKNAGEDLVLINQVPQNEGHLFMGWSADPGAYNGEYYPGQTYSLDQDITLYAIWKEIVEIPADAMGETITGEFRYDYDWLVYAFTPDETALYCFESFGDVDSMIALYDSDWYRISEDDDGGENNNFCLEYMLSEGVQYYIELYTYNAYVGELDFTVTKTAFEGETYTITYDANGGGGVPEDQQKPEGMDIVLSRNPAYCFGMTFCGWSTDPDSGEVEYLPGDTYSEDADITLYAVWQDAEEIPSNTTDGGFVAQPQFANHITYFTFTPEESGIYRFNSSTELDAWIELYDIYANCLAFNDDIEEDYNFLLEYGLEAGTTYCFAVGSWNYPGDTEGIHFTITKVGEYVPEDPTVCTIVYNTNNGNGAWATETYEAGTQITLIEDVLWFGDRNVNFRGWALNGDAAEPDYLPGEIITIDRDMTLQAVWEPATEIPSDIAYGSFAANLPFVNGYAYFVFTPDRTAAYAFESSGTQDTRVHLYDADGNALSYSDDDGENMNFLLSSTLTEGETYYLDVRYWGSSTGVINFTVTRLDEIVEPETCTIVYNANGGGTAPATINCEAGTEHHVNDILSPWIGHSFRGWALSADSETADFFPNEILTVTDNVVLYAVWEPAETISAEPAGESFTAEILFADGKEFFRFVPADTGTYCFESFTSMDTYISLYDASGNYISYDDDGGEDLNFALNCELNAGETYYLEVRVLGSGTGEVEFTASRIRQEYTVTYDANGGYYPPASQTKYAGEELILPNLIPTRENCVFMGWATASDAIRPEYYPGDLYAEDADLTLYAVWKIPIELSSDMEANVCYTVWNDIAYEEDWLLYTLTPSESGMYTFVGIGEADSAIRVYDSSGYCIASDDDSGANYNFLLQCLLVADTTYQIRINAWSGYVGTVFFNVTREESTDTVYEITYDANGAYSAPAPQYKEEGASITLSTTSVYWAGHTFLGWGLSAGDSEVEYLPGDVYTEDSDITLYAIWQDATVIPSDTMDGTFTAHIRFLNNLDIFSFTPAQSGTYRFESQTESQAWMDLMDGNGMWIAGSEGADELNFYLEYELEAGNTYYLNLGGWTSGGAGFFYDFTVTKLGGETAEGQIIVSDSTGFQGETVDVTISLANNPGIASMQLAVDYDSEKLTLVGIADSGNLGTAVHSDNLSLDPYYLTWANDLVTENFTFNGDIVTLTFAVAEDAEVGETPITVSFNYDNYDIIDVNGEAVAFETVSGTVNITDVILGDVNRDGRVNVQDRLILTRYLAKWTGYDEIDETAADVNCDGRVNVQDRLILTRFLAKWSGYEELPCGV